MKFDSKSLRAAFNYQYYQKEPGAWAHNNKYIVQILYDSIAGPGRRRERPHPAVRNAPKDTRKESSMRQCLGAWHWRA